MTGDQDENEDILGFGNTDHAPPAFRAITRLDRLVLRVTRRPRLVAIAAGLVVVALVAGAAAYLSPARATARPSVAQPRAVTGQCTPGQSKLEATQIAKLLKLAHQKVTDTSPAYSSTLTIQTVEGTISSGSSPTSAFTVVIACGR
jgi:hypothetical protein